MSIKHFQLFGKQEKSAQDKSVGRHKHKALVKEKKRIKKVYGGPRGDNHDRYNDEHRER